ncbi:MAG: ABC transporter ATP-binding protein [Planctomycetes bacterium]|nr:ABC transporter ATP-binding protein [Planctomycetota bacterium]
MIELRDLEFRYGEGGFRLRVAELSVPRGQAVAVIGPSGSGKTTLLHLVAGILLPDSGRIRIGETVVSGLRDEARRRFRCAHVGLVFQEFELIDYLDVMENLLLPYRINRALVLDAATRERARSVAARLGIEALLRRRPDRLSHGERQRVAIGRALLAGPRTLLADEPTGNLDPVAAKAIMDLLLSCARESGATLIAVTHDHSLLAGFDRVIDVGCFQGTEGA